MKNILIGGAWPYANGSLHIGHLAALLPGDVLARYHRKKGDHVLYVSGSDCHGTPISVRAKTEGVSPSVITDRYHNEFSECFKKLGFSYDLYTRTDDNFHKEEVKKIISHLYENGYIYEKEIDQVFCNHCQQFLPDRFVEGSCPRCGEEARGDQCDYCQSLLDPLDLIKPQCKTCGNPATIKVTKQLYFSLSDFEEALKDYVSTNQHTWRTNAIHTAKRYIHEGLQDRAITHEIYLGGLKYL